MELGRFFPEQAKLQIPTYFSYTTETTSPKYNPLDQDILMSEFLKNTDNKAIRDSILEVSQTVGTTKSFNITGAKVNIKSEKPKIYDPANISVTYAYSETDNRSPEIEQNFTKNQRGALQYSFSFSPKPWEPFKKSKTLSNPIFAIIKDININFMPSSIAFNTDMSRQYAHTKLRNLNVTGESFDKTTTWTSGSDFFWNREFNIQYDLSNSIKLSLQTSTQSNIIEPRKSPELYPEYYSVWRDSVWQSIRKLGTPNAYQQVFTASWNIPINKIPLLDWTTASASYNANYEWKRSAKIEGNTQIGNVISSMGAWQVNGNFNFENLYNKSAYLKKNNELFSLKSKSNKPPTQPKSYTEQVSITRNKTLTINHQLATTKYTLKATDKFGKNLVLSYKTIDKNTIQITPKIKADSVAILITSKEIEEEKSEKKPLDFIVRALMMVRRGSITYRESNSMALPGFLPEPKLLGQQSVDGNNAPGYAFTFGIVKPSFIEDAHRKGWLTTDSSVVTPATTAFTSDCDINLSLEPISGLKIDLNAKRYIASNTSTQYIGMLATFTGSYNITLVALSTAFTPIGKADQNYESKVFNTFIANRQKIAERLEQRLRGTYYPRSGFFKDIPVAGTEYNPANGSYNLNSADVLIPSFLAAYTGISADAVSTNPFLSLLSMFPNWRISYDGLQRIPWIKNKFKSVSLTHAYTCRYSIGSYTSYSTWVGIDGNNDALGYVRDVQSNNPIPSSPYDISNVSLSEQFSPLIGINANMHNNVNAKIEYRKQRNLSLNLANAQLIEATTDEFVVGVGYLLKDFDVILRLNNQSQAKVKNDLKLNVDFSYRDIKTLLRKIQENITQPSSGNKLLTIKFIADYVFSSKVNIQLFYDREMSSPLISSSFPVTTTHFGVSFKFMMTR